MRATNPRTGGRPDPTTGGRPGPKTGGRPDPKTGGRPDPKTGEVTGISENRDPNIRMVEDWIVL